MSTTTQLRLWWIAYRCQPSKMVLVGFPGVGRNIYLLVAVEAREAFEALAQIMDAVGYLFRESAGGTYNCRKIAGTDLWSLHAFGIAIDLNPSKNPQGLPLRSDFPPEFIAAVEGLRTNNGKKVFSLGLRWATPDAMHIQIDCAPLDLATGIAGAPAPEGNEMLPLTATSPQEDIRSLQDRLNRAYGLSLTEDGIYGSSTETAVKDHLLGFTGDTSETAKAGKRVNANMWNGLTEDWMRRAVGGGSGAVDAYTKAQSDQKYAPKVHPHSATTTIT